MLRHLLTAILFLFLWSYDASGCKCRRIAVAENFLKFNYIFVANVKKISKSEPRISNWKRLKSKYKGIEINFAKLKVEEKIKGAYTDRDRYYLVNRITGAYNCHTTVSEGERVLIFTNKLNNIGELSRCGPSKGMPLDVTIRKLRRYAENPKLAANDKSKAERKRKSSVNAQEKNELKEKGAIQFIKERREK